MGIAILKDATRFGVSFALCIKINPLEVYWRGFCASFARILVAVYHYLTKFHSRQHIRTRGKMDYLSNKIQFLIYCNTSYLHFFWQIVQFYLFQHILHLNCSVYIIVFTSIFTLHWTLPSHPFFFVNWANTTLHFKTKITLHVTFAVSNWFWYKMFSCSSFHWFSRHYNTK